MGVIEVKSFESFLKTQSAKSQAAAYAKSLGLEGVTVALFVPVRDEAVLAKLSGESSVDGVRVAVVAIGWG